jgi:hypothetical protein
MKVTDVWQAALIRLGADSKSARQTVAMISSCASSQAAFDAWDSRLPDGAGRALIKGIQAPDGAKLSEELLAQFRTDNGTLQYFRRGDSTDTIRHRTKLMIVETQEV